jgi:hypothetical protein
MAGDTRGRLLREREQERRRQELRQDADREALEQRERDREALRERLRSEREATHQLERRARQEREDDRTRTATERAAARELAQQRRAEREAELKRVQLDREVRRRAAAGDRSPNDEAYKSALEYDIYVRNSFGARETFMQQATRTQREHAEHIFRQVDAGSANEGKVSDPELLLHRVEQMRASMAKATARPNQRVWLVVAVVCVLVVAALYLAL